MGEGYRKSRQWFIKNFPTIMLGTAGLCGLAIGATAYFSPESAAKVGAGIGAAAIAGMPVLAGSSSPGPSFRAKSGSFSQQSAFNPYLPFVVCNDLFTDRQPQAGTTGLCL